MDNLWFLNGWIIYIACFSCRALGCMHSSFITPMFWFVCTLAKSAICHTQLPLPVLPSTLPSLLRFPGLLRRGRQSHYGLTSVQVVHLSSVISGMRLWFPTFLSGWPEQDARMNALLSTSWHTCTFHCQFWSYRFVWKCTWTKGNVSGFELFCYSLRTLKEAEQGLFMITFVTCTLPEVTVQLTRFPLSHPLETSTELSKR